jgi:hypothetical protein
MISSKFPSKILYDLKVTKKRHTWVKTSIKFIAIILEERVDFFGKAFNPRRFFNL